MHWFKILINVTLRTGITIQYLCEGENHVVVLILFGKLSKCCFLSLDIFVQCNVLCIDILMFCSKFILNSLEYKVSFVTLAAQLVLFSLATVTKVHESYQSCGQLNIEGVYLKIMSWIKVPVPAWFIQWDLRCNCVSVWQPNLSPFKNWNLRD